MQPTSTTELTPGLQELVERVRDVVATTRSDVAVTRGVAAAVRPALRLGDLLLARHQEGSEESYRQHVLHVEPGGAFSIVALVWLPGQSTPIHDHVSWCVVGVYQGEETELRYRVTGEDADRRLEVTERLINEPGSVCGVTPPGDIHQVTNTGSGRTLSIHVYGADIGRLGSSIRRCYDLPVG